MLRLTLKCVIGLAAILALDSCASISVQPDKESATQKKPEKIYIADFDTTHGDFKVDRDKVELADFKKNLQEMMQQALVTYILNQLVPAAPFKTGQDFGVENAWLIRGEFTRVNQGSRLLRGTIGFGAGGTKMETKISVYDLSQKSGAPFLTFSTTGGSGAEPGAITGLATDPLTLLAEAAISGVAGVAHGLTEDTRRTAREITAELSDYMYQQDWIPKEKWVPPKTLDQ